MTGKAEELSPDASAFLGKEYDTLKADYARFVATSADMLKYAATTSGAIFAWLAVTNMTSQGYSGALLVGWLAPLFLSLAYGAVAKSLWLRARRKGSYLAAIEERLFPTIKWIGWERVMEHESESYWSNPGSMHELAWVCLFVANFVVGCSALLLLKLCPVAGTGSCLSTHWPITLPAIDLIVAPLLVFVIVHFSGDDASRSRRRG